MENLFAHRHFGILLHPSSLPGSKQPGKLNDEAYCFIDFLASCSSSIWQVLPLTPTHEDNSPYQSYSRFAMDPKLLDIDAIRDWGWFTNDHLKKCFQSNHPLTDILEQFALPSCVQYQESFTLFKKHHDHWLNDYALYRAIKNQYGGQPWQEWPIPLRDRHHSAIDTFASLEFEAIEKLKFEQFLIFNVWHQIRAYAARKSVAIFGDIPLFVAHDSADVWANRSLFDLDADGLPISVAGVPPDYFSEQGQRWGAPHYKWKALEKNDYSWWVKTLKHHLKLFDLLRIDHFRGIESYWRIPANELSAVNGTWQKGPGKKLLDALISQLGTLPIVAEDLGIISHEVEELLEKYELPGMKILQFAFDSDASNPYLPHNHVRNSVVYTGTHDNDTTLGWFSKLDKETKRNCLQYLNFPNQAMPWPLIHSALASVARVAVIPMQDLLALDSTARMNTPGTTQGNWSWQFSWHDIPESLPAKLNALNKLYGRNSKSLRNQ
jgi:4-alpha-glucanotransferase